MAKYFQGKFKPKNPKKYKGDPTNIVYRSSLEFKFMRWCDENKDVISWASEEVIVPYVSPIDGKKHRYFPDFTIEVKTKDNRLERIMVEIKPESQTKPPKAKNEKTKSYLNEVKTWGVNSAKWEAAKEWCRLRNYKFEIITEKDLT